MVKINFVKHYFKRSTALIVNLSLAIIATNVYCTSDIANESKSESSEQQLTILLYHHIDDSTPPVTSTKPDLFKQHLEYLKQNQFKVLDLKEALQKLFSGKSLPEKAVAITFDDGYESIYDTAWPLLKKYQFPFTVFIATEPVEKSYALMMNWEQLRELSESGVTIANHTHSHAHLLGLKSGKMAEQIKLADSLLDKKIPQHAKDLFAYPYGEYSRTIAEKFKQTNRYAVTQTSGAISVYSDPQALPRFSFSGTFSAMSQFELKVNSLAMPVRNQTDYNPLQKNTTQTFELTFHYLPFSKQQFNCFYQNNAIKQVKWSDNQVMISLPQIPAAGRSRINCTAPAQNGQFYWHSIPIFVEPSNGQWPD